MVLVLCVCIVCICVLQEARWVSLSALSPWVKGSHIMCFDFGDTLCHDACFQFDIGEQVLDNLRDQFIEEMDATSVVHSLQHEGIISDAVLQQVTNASGRMKQNEVLHSHLKRMCTKDSLMTSCRKIIAVEGNPRMTAFGKDMLSKLEGKSVRTHDHMTQTQTLVHCTITN